MNDKQLGEIRARYNRSKQEGYGMMLLPFETTVAFQYVEQLEAEREEAAALLSRIVNEYDRIAGLEKRTDDGLADEFQFH